MTVPGPPWINAIESRHSFRSAAVVNFLVAPPGTGTSGLNEALLYPGGLKEISDHS